MLVCRFFFTSQSEITDTEGFHVREEQRFRRKRVNALVLCAYLVAQVFTDKHQRSEKKMSDTTSDLIAPVQSNASVLAGDGDRQPAAMDDGTGGGGGGAEALPGQSQPINAPAPKSRLSGTGPIVLPAVPASITATVNSIPDTPGPAPAPTVTATPSPAHVTTPNNKRLTPSQLPVMTVGGAVSTPPVSVSPMAAGTGSVTASRRNRPTTAGPQRDMNALTASIKSHHQRMAADQQQSGKQRNMFDGVDDPLPPIAGAVAAVGPAPSTAGSSAPVSSTFTAGTGSTVSSAAPTPDLKPPQQPVPLPLPLPTTVVSPTNASVAANKPVIVIRKSISGPAGASSPTHQIGGGAAVAVRSPPQASALPGTFGGQNSISPQHSQQPRPSFGGSVPGAGASGGGMFSPPHAMNNNTTPIDRRNRPTNASYGGVGGLSSPPENHLLSPTHAMRPTPGPGGMLSPPPAGSAQMHGRPSVIDLGLSSTVTRIIGGNAHNPVLGVGVAGGQPPGSSGGGTRRIGSMDTIVPAGDDPKYGRRPPQPIDTEGLLSPPGGGGSSGGGGQGSMRRPSPHGGHLQPLAGHRPTASFGDLPPMPELAADRPARRDSSPPRTPGINDRDTRLSPPNSSAGAGMRSTRQHNNSDALNQSGTMSQRPGHNKGLSINLPERPNTTTIDMPVPNLVLPPDAEKHVETFPYLWLMGEIIIIGLAIAGDVWTAVNVDVPALGSDASWYTKLAWACQGIFLVLMAITIVCLCIFKSPYNCWTALFWQVALSAHILSAAIITSSQSLWNVDLVIPYSDAAHFAMQFWWLSIILFYVMFTIMSWHAPHHIPPISADTLEKGQLVKQLRETRGALMSTRGILESVRPGLVANDRSGAAGGGGGGGPNMFPEVNGPTTPHDAVNDTATKKAKRQSQHRRPGSSHDQMMMGTASRRQKSGDLSTGRFPQKSADQLSLALTAENSNEPHKLNL